MGENNKKLDIVFQKIYDIENSIYAIGEFKSEIGKGFISQLLARIIGVKKSVVSKPVSLTINRNLHVEQWKRNFNGRKFTTTFYDFGELKIEKFKFIKICFKPIFDNSVSYESTDISIGILKLGSFFKIDSSDFQINDNEWSFQIKVLNRNSNLILRYWGKMKIIKITNET